MVGGVPDRIPNSCSSAQQIASTVVGPREYIGDLLKRFRAEKCAPFGLYSVHLDGWATMDVVRAFDMLNKTDVADEMKNATEFQHDRRRSGRRWSRRLFRQVSSGTVAENRE